jgi:hypothetical protein
VTRWPKRREPPGGSNDPARRRASIIGDIAGDPGGLRHRFDLRASGAIGQGANAVIPQLRKKD